MLSNKFGFKSFFQKKSVPFVIFISFILVNTILFLILGYFTTDKSSKILTSEITVYTSKVMEQAIRNLDNNLEDVQTPLIMLSNNPSVLACLKGYQSMTDTEIFENKKSISEVIASYWLKPLIYDLFIIGNNSFFYNSTTDTLKWDYDFLKQSWYKDSLNNKNGFINFGLHKQDYYKDAFKRDDKLTISIGLPIKSFNGDVLGSILCDLDLDKLIDILKLNTFEKSGYIFLSDKNGKILAHKDNNLVGTDFSIPGKSKILSSKLGSFIDDGPGGKMIYIYHTSKIADMKLISVIPVSEIKEHSQLLKHNIIKIFLISLIIEIVIFFILIMFLAIPFNKLINTMGGIKLNNLSVKKQDYMFWELNVIGRKFEELIENLNILIKENYESKLNLKEAELENLQSQINPHMLYNTLQMLQTEIVCGNIEESNNMLLSLSELFRYSVHKDMEMVPIYQEIKYLKNYFYICTRRFDGNLKVSFNISNKVNRYKIPRLLFQPIIENCIIHGFKECPANGEVLISADIVPKGILISVKDNGEGIRPDKLAKLTEYINKPSIKNAKVGLWNINQRIKLKYGDKYGITISSEKGIYTKINMLIAKLDGNKQLENSDC